MGDITFLGFEVKINEALPPDTIILMPRPTYETLVRCNLEKEKVYQWLVENSVMLKGVDAQPEPSEDAGGE